jgi:cyclohexanecarboxylate-CoA ligase
LRIEVAVTPIASVYHENGWWREQAFVDDLRRNAREQPGKAALITHQAATGQTQIISYAELAAATDTFTSALVRLGIKRGDVVAVQLPNWWEIAPLGLACARIGAQLCMLLTIYRRYELAEILGLTRARLCITVDEWGGARLADIVAGLAPELPGLEHVVVVGDDRPPGTLSFTETFARTFAGTFTETSAASQADGEAAAAVPAAVPAAGPDEPFLILFTSGTTGDRKGVVHSQNTLYAGCRAYAAPLGLDSSSVIFVAHTATHYTGFVLGMLLPILLGGTGVAQDVWDAGTHLDLAQRHGVTNFYGGPYILADLIAAQQADARDAGRLDSIVTGSAPVPPHVVEQVADLLGARVHALWGMTENGTVTITRREDPAGWAAHSDGSPVPGMELRIDTSAVRGAGDGSGRLWVRGANQCLGYFGGDDLYAASLDDEGWFDTGDLARDDGRGGIRITGRVKDVVIHNAVNVPVAEVEGVLARHPAVREVAVIGVPDDRGVDELVCAVIAPANSAVPDLAALHEHLAAAGVAELFWPERLEVVGTLPKTITGKVRKTELRDRFGAL